MFAGHTSHVRWQSRQDSLFSNGWKMKRIKSILKRDFSDHHEGKTKLESIDLPMCHQTSEGLRAKGWLPNDHDFGNAAPCRWSNENHASGTPAGYESMKLGERYFENHALSNTTKLIAYRVAKLWNVELYIWRFFLYFLFCYKLKQWSTSKHRIVWYSLGNIVCPGGWGFVHSGSLSYLAAIPKVIVSSSHEWVIFVFKDEGKQVTSRLKCVEIDSPFMFFVLLSAIILINLKLKKI